MAPETKNTYPKGLSDLEYELIIGNENSESQRKQPESLSLYFTIITGTLLILAQGTFTSWPSPVIPKLESNDTSINPLREPATTVQISMMVALPTLLSLLGALGAPLVADLLGRKMTLQLIGLGMFLCDIILAFSDRMIYIIISRSIFSIFATGSITVVLIFISEVCENNNRAKFGCVLGMCQPLGHFFSFLFGTYFNVRDFTLITAVPLVVFLALFWFTNESPVFLYSKNRKEESFKSLQYFRSNKCRKQIEADFEEIKDILNFKQIPKVAAFLWLFKAKQGRAPMILSFTLLLMQLASGSPILIPFLGPTFNKAEIGLSGNVITIIIGMVKVCCFLVSLFAVERFGRRPLLLLSTAGCGVSLLTVALFFYLKFINSPLIQSIQLLPLFAIIVYYVFYSFGIGTLPYTVAGELFSPEFRTIAISFIMTSMCIIGFLLYTAFPLVAAYVGVHWCLLFFSVCCILGTIFIYLFLPETGGKSISEIQETMKYYEFNWQKPVPVIFDEK